MISTNYNKSNTFPTGFLNEQPPEVILNVLDYLDIRDLDAIGCVSRRFSTFQNLPSVWEKQAKRISLLFLKEDSSKCEKLQFDYSSLDTMKNQVKTRKISFPEMNIFPTWESAQIPDLEITKRGLIEFTKVLQRDEYLVLLKKAIAYLPENSCIIFSWCGCNNVYIYKVNKEVVSWDFETDSNYLWRPSESDFEMADLILKDRIIVEDRYPESVKDIKEDWDL